MPLTLISHLPNFEPRFKAYVEQWEEAEKKNPNEDYYSMYQRVFEDYEAFIDHLVALRDPSRLEEKKPYVRFYWFLNDAEEIVGTIRYRTNIPAEFGNVGYEIAPKHRNKGYGKQMLKSLLEQLKREGVERLTLTLSADNIGSRKVVEYNGGTFVKKVKQGEKVELLDMYEIQINT